MMNTKCFECGEKTNLKELEIFEGDCSSCYHDKHEMEESFQYLDLVEKEFSWQPIAN